MIQDTINSIRVTMNERFGNPFVSSFIIACVIINWKVFLLLVSNVAYDQKISTIANLYQNNQTVKWDFFIYPLLFGLFWTVIWPVASLLINGYWYWMRSNISNVKLWAERKRRLSEAEGAQVYATIDFQEIKYLELLRNREKQVDAISRRYEVERNKCADLKNKIESLERGHEESLESSKEESRKLEDCQRRLHDTENSKNICVERIGRVEDEALRFIKIAPGLPGLKEVSIAINRTNGFLASREWTYEVMKKLNPKWTAEEMVNIINFFLAIGLIAEGKQGHITFGERYKYMKGEMIGMYDNSPGANGSE